MVNFPRVFKMSLAIDYDAAHFPTAATLAKVSLEAGGLLGWVWKKTLSAFCRSHKQIPFI